MKLTFELYPSTYFIDPEGSILAMNLRYRTSGLWSDGDAGNVFLRVISSYDQDIEVKVAAFSHNNSLYVIKFYYSMFRLMCKEPSSGWRGTKEMLLYITLKLFYVVRIYGLDLNLRENKTMWGRNLTF